MAGAGGKAATEGLVNSVPSRLEAAVMFTGSAVFVALVGALAVTQNSVSWSALAALAHAVDVLRQERTINLALVGFVAPPLPALFYLPLVWLGPEFAETGQTVWLFGGLVAGATLVTLNAGCADVGLTRAARWLFCMLVLLNPVFLGLTATGAPDGLYLFLLLGGGWALLRWQRRETLRDLIGCSLFLSLAVVTRYDAIAPVLAATLVVGIQTLRRGTGWSKLEGTLITFLLPIVYVTALWLLANRLIMGDVWHFLKETYKAQVQRPEVRIDAEFAAERYLVLALAFWALAAGGAYGRRRLATGAGLMLLSAPLITSLVVFTISFLGRFGYSSAISAPVRLPTIPDALVPSLAAAILLTASVLPDVGLLCRGKGYFKEALVGAAAVAVILGGMVASGAEWRLYVDPRPAFVGLPLGADDASSTKMVANRIRAESARGTLIAAGWPGYAVMLYAGRVKDKMLLPDTSPPSNAKKLRADGGVLVRSGPDARKTRLLAERWEEALGVKLSLVFKQDGWAYFRPVGAWRTERY